MSSIPTVNDVYSTMSDPSFGIENTLDIEIAKYRILLRRMICEAYMNRTRSISGGSPALSYFLVALFVSIAQSIRCMFSTVPTDPTDFTVVAMRNLLGYIFTTLAAGEHPLSNIWKLLSSYPTRVPGIEGFKAKELWIVSNLTDMFPYCVWGCASANFKKNILTGITKMLASYIITDELKEISVQEKLEMAKRIKEIGEKYTTVWQWQKVVVISIVKLGKNDKSEKYDAEFIKAISKVLLDKYPDVDETMISNNHMSSNSSRKLKDMLNVALVSGEFKLNELQLQTIRDIISKRMHAYYYDMSKAERKKHFSTMSLSELDDEFSKY